MQNWRWWLLGVAALYALTAYMPAYAGEGWDNKDRTHVCDGPASPRLDKCHEWVQRLERPDLRGASCCADADAYVSDNFRLTEDGELEAQINGHYPDDAPVHDGDWVKVPKDRINTLPEDAGNTSGHGAIFIHPGMPQPLCYSFPPLT